MKVTIISANLANNCLGRAYILAELLEAAHEVEIVGTVFGPGIWPPADTGRFAYRSVPGSLWPTYSGSFRRLLGMITGDVIIASKPLPTSFGAALLSKGRRRRPLILDIDDDEIALTPVPPFRRVRAAASHLIHPNNGWATRYLHRRIAEADGLTVASRGLQAEFGGELIRHAKNTDWLRPRLGEQQQAKAALGLSGRHVAMFLGSPHPWKGVHTAAEAMGRMTVDATLAIVGASSTDEYARSLASLPKVAVFPPRPMTDLPFLLQAADVVVIPQLNEARSSRQLPSKLMDAMAAGRPIVASAIGDIPDILSGGRGLLVPPGDPDALANAIDQVLDAPADAAAMGRRAREWCEQHASINAVSAKLTGVIERAFERVNPSVSTVL